MSSILLAGAIAAVIVTATDGVEEFPYPAPARVANMSWDTIPLYAHFRMANFSQSDLKTMMGTLRMVTMQGTVFGNMPSEVQAKTMRLALPTLPVLTYRNVYYSEGWDASQAVMRAHPEWQLKDAHGKVINPEGKLAYNMSISAVVSFYSDVIANLSNMEWIDGAFGDSGCGERPNWMPATQGIAFAQGQWEAAAKSQANLSSRGGVFVSNCPYLRKTPSGSVDPWPTGVKGIMFELWCSDFQTGNGGCLRPIDILTILIFCLLFSNNSIA
eukprot:m.217523 g.217523  ORF g.217523 m.217523 type:complete len:271 (+) comp15887_c0_seq5:18-830(+)